jgi:two-component system sensor histidine kinase YesM
LGFSLLLFSLLCVLLFVIIMILTQAFARRNAGEIRELTRAVAALDHGDVGYELSAQCSEEFQGLYSQFKQLVRNNNQLQERRRRMEVRHLEEQFNPHFVFNVMETVRYQIGEDPETACEMLQSFANLMRYSINYGHTKVALETDVEYINDYLLLQKIRYNNALRFQLNIPDELLECQVPKLLLQPVIENSIRHGFVQGRTLEILVEAEQAGGDLRFTVQDNGAGIPRERLEAIRESFSLELDSGIVRRIGLYNVQKVVSLLYGPEYGLSIESTPGAGTRVTLTMPWEMEE